MSMTTVKVKYDNYNYPLLAITTNDGNGGETNGRYPITETEAEKLRDDLLKAHPLPKPKQSIVARLYGPTGSFETEVRLPSYVNVFEVAVHDTRDYAYAAASDPSAYFKIRKVQYRNVGPEFGRGSAGGPWVYKFVYDGEG